MRIKPYVILGLATVAAGSALGIVVTVSEPATAGTVMKGFFWAALFLTIWGLIGTVLTAFRVRLARALAIGLCLAILAIGWLVW